MSLYHANCHLVVVSLVFRFRSFLSFQKAELGCKYAELGCHEAGLACHNTKVKMLSFLTPEGAPNNWKLIISPEQVALVVNGVMDNFFYLEITPMYFFCNAPVNNFSVTLGRVFLG